MNWHYHSWISYEDVNGRSGCEPEAFALLPEGVLLVECKLTGCRYGHAQMQDLYAPLLAELFQRPVKGLQIAQRLAPSSPGPFFSSVEEFLAAPAAVGTLLYPGH